MKKLYRSKTNRFWLGVLGGIGEYLNVDPVVLRLGFVILTVITGFFPGVVIYILAAIIMPESPGGRPGGTKNP